MTKPILITGAARGLGAALAETLALAHHIIAVAKTTGALEELDDRIQAKGGQATLAPMDITQTDAMAHLCRSIYDRWGGIRWWFHTAVHAAPLAPTDHIDAKDWEKSVLVNTTATAQLIPMIAPLLGPQGQAVFFDDAMIGGKFTGAYGASKTAQLSLARAWQAETLQTGPQVHIMTPAPMPTATRARFFPGENRDALHSCQSQADRILTDLGLC
ncbi:MAG: SDR family NAD(P)-dependent oxidoreductase [Pseudomonadota bacterium]